MPEGGVVKLPVVPDFAGFASLFSGGIRGAVKDAPKLGDEVGKLLGGGVKTGLKLGLAGAGVALTDFIGHGIRHYARLGEQTLQLQHLTGAPAEQASLFASV